jgi:endonuclease YncB( thermonuclease family)
MATMRGNGLRAILLFALCCCLSAEVVPHIFPAEIVRVIDGDTFEVRLNLGLDLIATRHVRLEGVEAPEVRGAEREAGLVVAAAAAAWLERGAVFVAYRSTDSFGRVIGDILAADGTPITAFLLTENLALPRSPRGRPVFPPEFLAAIVARNSPATGGNE